MNDTTTLNVPADDAASYQTVVDHYLAEINRLQRQMDDDQAEIETMQAETREILADIMASLTVH